MIPLDYPHNREQLEESYRKRIIRERLFKHMEPMRCSIYNRSKDMAVQFNNKSSSPAPELGQPVSAEIAYSLDQFMSKEFPQVLGTLRGFQHLPGLSLMGFSKLSVVKSLCTVLQKKIR